MIYKNKMHNGDSIGMENYEKVIKDSIINNKLRESIIASELTDERYDFEQVSKEMREKLIEKLKKYTNE